MQELFYLKKGKPTLLWFLYKHQIYLR